MAGAVQAESKKKEENAFRGSSVQGPGEAVAYREVREGARPGPAEVRKPEAEKKTSGALIEQHMKFQQEVGATQFTPSNAYRLVDSFIARHSQLKDEYLQATGDKEGARTLEETFRSELFTALKKQNIGDDSISLHARAFLNEDVGQAVKAWQQLPASFGHPAIHQEIDSVKNGLNDAKQQIRTAENRDQLMPAIEQYRKALDALAEAFGQEGKEIVDLERSTFPNAVMHAAKKFDSAVASAIINYEQVSLTRQKATPEFVESLQAAMRGLNESLAPYGVEKFSREEIENPHVWRVAQK